MKKRRILELDCLRGLAILAIILFHYTTRYGQLFGHSPFKFSFPLGYLGVQLFFIISGFSILMAYKKTEGALHFGWKRLVRLYPSYWVAIVLIFITTTIFPLPGREIGFKDFLINFTMVQRWLGMPDVDFLLWFLPVILTFYGLFFLTIVAKQVKRIGIIMVGWTIIGFLFLTQPVLSRIGPPILRVSFRYIHLFTAGILFYQLKTTQKKLLPTILLLITLIPQLIIFKYIESIIVLGFYLIMFLLITNRLKWLRNRSLAFTGLISYQLYLIHNNIGYVIIRQLLRFKINSLIIFLVPVFVSFILATLTFSFVKKLFNK